MAKTTPISRSALPLPEARLSSANLLSTTVVLGTGPLHLFTGWLTINKEAEWEAAYLKKNKVLATRY